MKKFIAKIVSEYSSESLEIQKKAKILTIINLLIFFSMIGLLPVTIFLKHIPGFIIILATSLLQVASLVLLKKRHYKISSSMIIIFILFANTWSVVSNLYATNRSYAELYVEGFILIFLIIEACLISCSMRQIILTTVFCICGVLFVYFYRVLPNDNWQIVNISLMALSAVTFMLATAGFIGWLILRITKDLIRVAEEEAVLNKKRYKQLESIMTTSKHSMEIGEHLIFYSKNTMQMLNKIEDFFHSMRDEIGNLHSVIDISQEVNTDVVHSTEQVTGFVNQQNSAIEESSAAINEMLGSVNSISDIMRVKKDAANALLGFTKMTENEIRQSIDLINKISKSSDEINTIIGAIMNIADHIKLLSITATIEAAHAGKYGKGFNVVASEIKNLANNTNNNTKRITSTLTTNIKDIKLAEKINDSTGLYFHKLAGEIEDLIKAIEEASNGLLEISKGSREIIKAVEHMMTLSGEVLQSMNKAAGKVNNSIKSIKDLDTVYITIQTKIEEIYNYFKKIKEDVSAINAIGEKNITHIRNLGNEIKKVNEEEV